MLTIVWKLLSLLGPVALGYTLKRIGFFGPRDYQIMSKIALNVTLPAAVISSFASTQMDLSYLLLTVIALGIDWSVLLFSWLTTRHLKDRPRDRITAMLCSSGYSLGNFLIPFMQQFMSAASIAMTSIFDIGNSLMCTAGNFIFATSVVKTENSPKTTVRGVLKKLFSSVLLDVYLVMIALMLLDITIPDPVATIVSTTGSANGFVTMFMIGLMFDVRFEPAYLRAAAEILLRKYGCAIVIALVVFFLFPLPLATRQVLALIAFGPTPCISSVFVEQIQGDVGLASFVTSLSFLISCIAFVILMAGMGIL